MKVLERLALLSACFVLSGCLSDKETTTSSQPLNREQVQNWIQTHPPLDYPWVVKDIELQMANNGKDAIQVAIEIRMELSEPLYQTSQSLEILRKHNARIDEFDKLIRTISHLPPDLRDEAIREKPPQNYRSLQFAEPIQKKGHLLTISGTLSPRRDSNGHWSYHQPSWKNNYYHSGLKRADQLGPRYRRVDTPEGKQQLEEIIADINSWVRLVNAFHEQKELGEKKILQSVHPGRTWTGIWSKTADFGKISLRFNRHEATGNLLYAEVFDPANPAETRIVKGRVISPHETTSYLFPLQLKAERNKGLPPLSSPEKSSTRTLFLRENTYCYLQLRYHNEKLIGKLGNYTIELSPEDN